MISFESDYNNGTLPEILEALGKTNDEKNWTESYRDFCHKHDFKSKNPTTRWSDIIELK